MAKNNEVVCINKSKDYRLSQLKKICDDQFESGCYGCELEEFCANNCDGGNPKDYEVEVEG